MALELTERARLASGSNNLTPNLVFSIEGVSEKYGVVTILDYIRVGDPGLLIGNDWVIGGFNPILDQLSAITFEGSSTKIDQKLDIDKGSGSSVSQMAIAMVDVDQRITELITPGFVVDDILGRKCSVHLGFGNTAFPSDYIRIFRGIIDQVSSAAGRITFQISHPDQKKRQSIFLKAESQLDGAIGPSDTTITLLSTAGFQYPITGANGLEDSTINYGIRIEDEVIFYTGISGNQLTGCTRGALFTLATSHADEENVASYINFTGTAMDLALKVMCSGWNGPYESNYQVTNFNVLGDATIVSNAIYFDDIDMVDEYGVVIGDYITTTGATAGANNVTNKQIIDIIKTFEGTYIVIDDVSFVDETATAAVIDFRSQYDTYHPGSGMGLHNNEVDILEHERIRQFFLSSFEYTFNIQDTQKGKDWLESQIYFPAAAYSLPRKSKSSVGYHIGPLPGSDIKIIDSSNTTNASKLVVKRGINNNFYNTIVYQYEEKVLEADKFVRGRVTVDSGSKAQIPIGTKALVIPSTGMREVLSGQQSAISASNRRLRRYKLGSEWIEGLNVTLGSSMSVEIGDIVLVDFASLKLADTKNGTRDGEPRLCEVYNKTLDPKTGKVVYSVIDTSYSTASRYCLMSPSTRVSSASTTIVLRLKVTHRSIFGANEGRKWSRYIGAKIRVRSDDLTTRNDVSTILSVSGNTLTLNTPLSFTPLEDDTITFVDYDEILINETGDKIKLIYGSMTDQATFFDGSQKYQMI